MRIHDKDDDDDDDDDGGNKSDNNYKNDVSSDNDGDNCKDDRYNNNRSVKDNIDSDTWPTHDDDDDDDNDDDDDDDDVGKTSSAHFSVNDLSETNDGHCGTFSHQEEINIFSHSSQKRFF